MAGQTGAADVQRLISFELREGRQVAIVATPHRFNAQNRGGKAVGVISCSTEISRAHAVVVPSAEQPEIRVDKVLEIRRQLGEGTYSIADRLDAVVDKIIEELA